MLVIITSKKTWCEPNTFVWKYITVIALYKMYQSYLLFDDAWPRDVARVCVQLLDFSAAAFSVDLVVITFRPFRSLICLFGFWGRPTPSPDWSRCHLEARQLKMVVHFPDRFPWWRDITRGIHVVCMSHDSQFCRFKLLLCSWFFYVSTRLISNDVFVFVYFPYIYFDVIYMVLTFYIGFKSN